MELRKAAPQSAEVHLSGAELESLGLSLEGGTHQRELAALAHAACGAVGICLHRPTAQIVPDGEGGCTILLRGRSPSGGVLPARAEASPVIYAFEDVDLLIRGAVRLFGRCAHRIRKSALYRVPHGWRLLLWPLDWGEGISLGMMDEYAPRCGQGPLAAAWVAEHGHLLVERDAVGMLSSYFK